MTVVTVVTESVIFMTQEPPRTGEMAYALADAVLLLLERLYP